MQRVLSPIRLMGSFGRVGFDVFDTVSGVWESKLTRVYLQDKEDTRRFRMWLA